MQINLRQDSFCTQVPHSNQVWYKWRDLPSPVFRDKAFISVMLLEESEKEKK